MARLFMNEARILRREPGLWILLAAYVVLLGYGAVQSVDRVRARQAQIVDAAKDYQARWSAMRKSADAPVAAWGDWRSASLVGGPIGFAVTWIPVDGLAALSAGESLRLPSVKRVSIYSSRDEPPLQNPLAPAGGLFDLSFVVIWLLPLTLVAAAHGAVSADRQQGTWPLVAATSPAPWRILLARLAWPATVLAGVTITGGIAAVSLAAPLPDAAAWLRLAAWSGVVVAYIAFWAIATGIATARSANAPMSLVSMGLFWIAMVWIVPSLINAGVSATVPPSNRLDAHLAAREAERDLEHKLPDMVEDIYRQHPDWRPSAEAVAAATKPVPGGPASRDARRVYAPALAAAGAAAPYARAGVARRQRTEQLVRQWSWLSPGLAVQLISDHLAGTSADRFVHFEQHTTDAERTWHAFFASRIMQLRDMTRADMDQVPVPDTFSIRPDTRNILWPLAGLTVALAVAGLGLRGSFSTLGR